MKMIRIDPQASSKWIVGTDLICVILIDLGMSGTRNFNQL